MDAITIHQMVYILKLEQDKYYVGITYNLNLRMGQHFGGFGSKFTQEYKPVELIKVIPFATKETELLHTLLMMKEHGYKNVRGSFWCKINDPVNNPINDEKYSALLINDNKKD